MRVPGFEFGLEELAHPTAMGILSPLLPGLVTLFAFRGHLSTISVSPMASGEVASEILSGAMVVALVYLAGVFFQWLLVGAIILLTVVVFGVLSSIIHARLRHVGGWNNPVFRRIVAEVWPVMISPGMLKSDEHDPQGEGNAKGGGPAADLEALKEASTEQRRKLVDELIAGIKATLSQSKERTARAQSDQEWEQVYDILLARYGMPDALRDLYHSCALILSSSLAILVLRPYEAMFGGAVTLGACVAAIAAWLGICFYLTIIITDYYSCRRLSAAVLNEIRPLKLSSTEPKGL